MKILLSLVMATLLVGCATEQPQQPEQAKVKMSAANEICFEASEALATGLKEQGQDPDKYFSSDCGTLAQAQAFKDKNYEVIR